MLIERQLNRTAPPFRPLIAVGMVYQNASHHLRGDPEEMRSTLPVRPLIDEAQVGFIHKAGGLKGMAGVLPPHVAPGQTAELIVDQWHHLV